MLCNSTGFSYLKVSYRQVLNITIMTMSYNTTVAYYRFSSPGHDLCTYRLPFLGQNVAVLSSGLKEVS
jgi:hypothetical protein